MDETISLRPYFRIPSSANFLAPVHNAQVHRRVRVPGADAVGRVSKQSTRHVPVIPVETAAAAQSFSARAAAQVAIDCSTTLTSGVTTSTP